MTRSELDRALDAGQPALDATAKEVGAAAERFATQRRRPRAAARGAGSRRRDRARQVGPCRRQARRDARQHGHPGVLRARGRRPARRRRHGRPPTTSCFAISKSGATAEVVALRRHARRRSWRARSIAMTGCGGASPLCGIASASVDIGVGCESDPWDIVPTSSTAVALAVGDALAVALMVARGFGPAEFGAAPPRRRARRSARWRRPVIGNGRQGRVCVVGSFMMDLGCLRAAPPRSRRDPRRHPVRHVPRRQGLQPGDRRGPRRRRDGAWSAGSATTTSAGRFLRPSTATGSTARTSAVDPDEGTGIGLPLIEHVRRELDRHRPPGQPARQPSTTSRRRGRRDRSGRRRCSCSSSCPMVVPLAAARVARGCRRRSSCSTRRRAAGDVSSVRRPRRRPRAQPRRGHAAARRHDRHRVRRRRGPR